VSDFNRTLSDGDSARCWLFGPILPFVLGFVMCFSRDGYPCRLNRAPQFPTRPDCHGLFAFLPWPRGSLVGVLPLLLSYELVQSFTFLPDNCVPCSPGLLDPPGVIPLPFPFPVESPSYRCRIGPHFGPLGTFFGKSLPPSFFSSEKSVNLSLLPSRFFFFSFRMN